MAPRLRVLAGTSPSNMVPITTLVNTNTPHRLSSPLFEGEIVAHIAGLTDEEGRKTDSEYFKRADKSGVTWSIQVQGRFLVPYSADDVLFGNTFDRPLKLPWGTGAILKFMHYIDPTLDHDLLSQSKPWALSPLIATMPYLAHKRLKSAGNDGSSSSSSSRGSTPSVPSSRPRQPVPPSSSSDLPHFPPATSLKDDTSELYRALRSESTRSGDDGEGTSEDDRSSTRSGGSSSASSVGSGSSKGSQSGKSVDSAGSGGGRFRSALKKVAGGSGSSSGGSSSAGGSLKTKMAKEVRELKSSSERRGYFSNKEKRKEVVFGPKDVITTDFCYGFINFAPSLALQLPGGLSFDLMKYWDGQPVRFVCCERKGSGSHDSSYDDSDDDVPWGRVFWCVAIEMAD